MVMRGMPASRPYAFRQGYTRFSSGHYRTVGCPERPFFSVGEVDGAAGLGGAAGGVEDADYGDVGVE
jgi:hypothetical protein